MNKEMCEHCNGGFTTNMKAMLEVERGKVISVETCFCEESPLGFRRLYLNNGRFFEYRLPKNDLLDIEQKGDEIKRTIIEKDKGKIYRFEATRKGKALKAYEIFVAPTDTGGTLYLS